MNILRELGIDSINPGTASGKLWYRNNNFTSINPTTEEIIASVEETTSIQLERVIENARENFLRWRLVSIIKRGELIRLIGEKIRYNKDLLGSLIALEMGKSKQEGDGEIQEVIDMADFALGQIRRLNGVTLHSERIDHRIYEQWHPLGVVAIITPFNFPIAIWAWNAFLAIVCGNSVIWKPSIKTPLCAIAIHKICISVCNDYGYPDVFSLVNFFSIELMNQLVDNHQIALVSFTGSSEVGSEIRQRVNKRFGRTLLELGGNNASIIDYDMDYELLMPAIVFGSIGTTGQRCTSLRRLIIHEDIYEKFLLKLVNFYSLIKVGDPLNPNNHMGPLIDENARTNYKALIDKIQQSDGKIIFGGKEIQGKGFFVQPTIVVADFNLEIVKKENFVPILFVTSFKNLIDAININNQVDYGLSSSIFTNNLQHAEYFISTVGSDCGIANINTGTSGAEIGSSFGGEKASGGGREAGIDSWQNYMRRQTVTINYGKTYSFAQEIKFNIE